MPASGEINFASKLGQSGTNWKVSNFGTQISQVIHLLSPLPSRAQQNPLLSMGVEEKNSILAM